jgi:putative restriction endonuclease
VLPVLEAAHLRPYRGAHTNLVTNGLLLRADIHTLLDCKLWAPEPGTRAIAISRLLIGTPYNEPATPAQRPADSVLEKVWQEFRQAETKRHHHHLDHDSTPTAEMHDRSRTPRG